MRLRKLVGAMITAFAAMLGHAGDSAPFVLNNATSPFGESVVLQWNAAWIGGDANATVVIMDNGTEVKRTTGAGEFTYMPVEVGRHELTYTTRIGDVEQDEVYIATVYVKWKYSVVDGGAVITATTQKSGNVTIPDVLNGYPVTGIANNVFKGCDGLTSVTVPGSVTNIGDCAFTENRNLHRIVLPVWLKGLIDESACSGNADDFEIVYIDGVGIYVNAPDMDFREPEDCLWSGDMNTSHDGIASAQLKGMGQDSESSIELQLDSPGRLSFWWKASSESDGNNVFDYAYLSIDGMPQGMLNKENYSLNGVAIGGKTGWRHKVIDVVGKGSHVIRWTYAKDEIDEGNTGDDCAWLDEVEFTPLAYLSFDIAGGTGMVPAEISELEGTVVTLPAQSGFEWEDHVFNGWSDGKATYASESQYVMPATNVTLTAQWIAKRFLTFALAGGTGAVPAEISELEGTVVTLPAQSGFEWKDHVFNGWCDGKATYAAESQYVVPATNVTFTAQWIAKRFLTFSLDGGEGQIPVTLKDVPGAEITLPSANGISRTKHVFVGWSDGATTYDAGANYRVTDASVEFKAVWQRKEAHVSIVSDDVVNGGTVDTQGATISMSAWTNPSVGTPAIYYTLDGTEPTTSSTRYEGPFFVGTLGDVTVRALAVLDDCFDGEATFSFARLPYSLSECVAMEGVNVAVGGATPWFRVTGEAAHDGKAAMRSGVIGDGENSYVEMQVHGEVEVSFWWKISSQNKVRADKHDYLAFSVDGEEVLTLGGGVIDWTNATYAVTGSGRHSLRWTYSKDGADASSEDCAWLDDVTWTPEEVAVIDPLPEVATDYDVANVLTGAADETRLRAHISGKAQYDLFRAWVNAKGLDHQTVKNSARAWFSYAIGANGLVEKAFQNDDVTIKSLSVAANGGFSFEVDVKDVALGAAATAENLATVFGIQGAASLREGAFSSKNVSVMLGVATNGRLSVTTTPKQANDAFFIRVRMHPDADAED